MEEASSGVLLSTLSANDIASDHPNARHMMALEAMARAYSEGCDGLYMPNAQPDDAMVYEPSTKLRTSENTTPMQCKHSAVLDPICSISTIKGY